MATIQSQLVNDNSTYANYSAWASAISVAFQTFTWIQSNDTGQVMWTGMNLTAVSMSGTTATYTFNSLTGLALTSGRALTITGMTTGANNGTFVVTSVTGTTSGTFTVTNASGVNEGPASTGVVTKQTTVPGSGAFFYEIWVPNDGLATFYVKLETGNASGTNSPAMRLSLSTTTSGTGTPTGFTFGPLWCDRNAYGAAPSTSTQYECNFSGAAGRIGVMMWRNAPTGGSITQSQQLFAIERSLSSLGAYTASYVTLYCCGQNTTLASSGVTTVQQSIVFGVGAGVFSGNNGSWFLRMANGANSLSSAFNGTIAIDTAAPYVGYFDYNATVIGCALALDLADGVTFTASLYGSTRTFMPGKSGAFNAAGSLTTSSNYAVLMRYD